MNFVIRNIVYLFIGITFASPVVAEELAISKIIRNYILDGGYVNPITLYENSDENLSLEGELLFESENLSLNGGIACSTCHFDGAGSGDGIPNAAGVRGEGEGAQRLLSGGKIIPRNTLALWGVGSKGFDTLFWDGKIDFSQNLKLSQFGSNPPSADPLVTAVHLPAVEIRETVEEDDFIRMHKREDVDGATVVYKAIVDRLRSTDPQTIASLAAKLDIPAEEVEFVHISRAIAAFIRSEFRLRQTRLNAFVEGKIKLTKQELDGARIFYGKGGCVGCHSGPQFTDLSFHTIPFPQLGFGKNGFGIDYGRYNTTFDPQHLYQFRTPSLYNVAKTAPYGHSGSVDTLYEAIVAHFDPLNLINLDGYSPLQRHEFYKFLARSDTANVVNYLSSSEVDSLVKFMELLSFEKP